MSKQASHQPSGQGPGRGQPGGPGLGHEQQDEQDLGPLPGQGPARQQGDQERGPGRQQDQESSRGQEQRAPDVSEKVHNVQDEPGSQQTG